MPRSPREAERWSTRQNAGFPPGVPPPGENSPTQTGQPPGRQGKKLEIKPDTFLSYTKEIETPILVSPIIMDNVHGNERFSFQLRILSSSEQQSAPLATEKLQTSDQSSGKTAICKPTQRNFGLGEVDHHSSRTLLWAKSKRFPSLSQPLPGTEACHCRGRACHIWQCHCFGTKHVHL